MRTPIALAALLAAASSTLGCGATVEIPSICFTEQGIAVPGSPAGGSVTSPTFNVDLTNQIPLLRTNDSDTDLRVDQVTITPVAGSPDLSGVETAVVQVRPATGSAVNVVAYERAPAAPPPAALVLAGPSGNIAPDLVGGRASFSFTLEGQPPSGNWTADVETCLHGQATASP